MQPTHNETSCCQPHFEVATSQPKLSSYPMASWDIVEDEFLIHRGSGWRSSGRHVLSMAVDLKLHFQSGEHAGQWGGFDDRGVPHLNSKGKKLTRKEKELVETEYMAAKKRCQQQLKAWDDWENRLSQAEKALKRQDRVRWAYRAAGTSKHDILQPEDLKVFIAKMGWDAFGKADFETFQKAVVDGNGEHVLLQDIRNYMAGQMPPEFLENRMEHFFDQHGVEGLHSPRTWRHKLSDLGQANQVDETSSSSSG
eukprot:symbB.v1.2.014325.t1/scaffold1046.1/size141965/3